MKFAAVRFSIIYYVTLILSACGGSFESYHFGQKTLPSIQAADLRPATDKLDPDCATSDTYDACIFLKSPSFQTSQLYDNHTPADLESKRHWGVLLTDLDGSGNLSNKNFEIRTADQQPVKRTAADTQALMAYYWINRAVSFYQSQTAGLLLQSKGLTSKKLKVIVDDETAGFRPQTNSIHLSRGLQRLSMALDASIVLHYLGRANVYWLSEGGIQDNSQGDSHRTCGGDPKGCCKTASGCAQALASGSADYFVATLFPEAPVIGETWNKDLNGQDMCGVSRSLSEARNLQAATAFEKCSGNLKGQVHLMGLLYASIWWEVRLQIENLQSGEVPYIDRLYLEHLKSLKGHHTFSDALKSLLEADQRLYQGRFSSLFTAEFRRRGL